MTGFKLQTDRHSCVPEGEFPCGRLPDPVTTSTCCHGNCPWQASLLNSWGEEMCGGVVLGRHTILTSARCLLLDSGSARHTSTFFVVVGENRMFLPVRALHIHNRFRLDHHDNDLALLELAKPLHFGPSLLHLCLPTKDFSENILMHSGRTGVAGRRGGRQNQELVYMTLDECRGELSVSHPLSNKMFCMRRQTVQEEGQHEARGPAAGPVMNQNGSQNTNGRVGHQGAPIGAKHKNSSSENTEQTPSGLDGGLRMEVGSRRCNGLLPGSPVTTLAQGTAFLTGLLISPAGSDGLVFTKLSRYLTWIRPRLKAAEDRMMPQVNQYPEAR
nr:PREDICTED: venom prothrombin activator porpharin-D-like [Paralichthys olivaceus]